MEKKDSHEWIADEDHSGLQNLGKDDLNFIDQTEHRKIGDPEYSIRKSAQKLLWKIFIILFILAIIVWLSGRINTNNIASIFKTMTSTHKNIDLLDSKDGIVLMTEIQNNSLSIYIKRSGEAGWRNLSKSDFTACNPALSNSGKKVAYLSMIKIPHIVIQSLNSESIELVTTKKINQKLMSKKLELENSNVCEWTKIRWSPNDSLIAFFAYKLDSQDPFVVVADLSYTEPQIVWFEENSEKNKNIDVIWLDSTTLLLNSQDLENKISKVSTLKID